MKVATKRIWRSEVKNFLVARIFSLFHHHATVTSNGMHSGKGPYSNSFYDCLFKDAWLKEDYRDLASYKKFTAKNVNITKMSSLNFSLINFQVLSQYFPTVQCTAGDEGPVGNLSSESIFADFQGLLTSVQLAATRWPAQIWISCWILPHFDVRTISVAWKLKSYQISNKVETTNRCEA